MKNKLYGTACTFFIILTICLVAASSGLCEQRDYDGEYAGSYTGSESGVWISILDANDESTFVSYSPTSGQVDGGLLIWEGEAGTVGTYSTNATNFQDSEVSADFDASDDQVEGNLENAGNSQSGNLSGEVIDSTADNGLYTGTVSGYYSGNFALSIAEDGRLACSFACTTSSGAIRSINFRGVSHPDGYVLMIDTDHNGQMVVAYATITDSGVNGRWLMEDGNGGSFTNQSDNPAAGCFILNLMDD